MSSAISVSRSFSISNTKVNTVSVTCRCLSVFRVDVHAGIIAKVLDQKK